MPDGPAIVLANEFFDALPVHQAIKQSDGWHERVVEIDADGNLAFGIADDPIPLFDQLLPPSVRDAPIGAIYEWRTDNLALELGRARGAPGRRGAGRSTTAMSRARSATPCRRSAATPSPIRWQSPGEVDLTAHVDFQALALAAESMGARVHGPVDQAEFLRGLGIEKRAAALEGAMRRRRRPPRSTARSSGLLGEGRTGMGKLFKVIAHRRSEARPLAGLRAADR